MRILHTMTGSWGTGSGTVVEALVRAFAARGHEVCVLYPQTEGAPTLSTVHAPEARHEVWPFPLRDGDAALYTFPLMIPDPNPTNFEGAWTFRDLEQAQLDLYVRSFGARFDEVVADFRPDAIECHHIWAMPYAVAQRGVTYTVCAHHSDQMGFEYDPRIRPYATEAARRACAVFAIGERVKQEVVELYDVPPERVLALGNGYDKATFRPVTVDRAALLTRHGLDVPEDAVLVTFAGKLSHTKGVDILLDAMRRIERDADGPPVHLILFGTGRIEDVKGEAPMPGNVHLLGHQPYAVVRDFHNAAVASVMPSRTEGFGLAALEAMGCGLPVVTTAVGAADTFAIGPVVPPADTDALTDAIRHLTRLPETERDGLRQQALERASHFSWDAIAEARLDTYARCARGAFP